MGFDAAIVGAEELFAGAAADTAVGVTAADVAAAGGVTGATAFGTGAALDAGVAAGAGAGTLAGAGGAAIDAGTAFGAGGVGAGTAADVAGGQAATGPTTFGTGALDTGVASPPGAGTFSGAQGAALDAGGGGAGFLPVTGAGGGVGGVQQLSPELAQSLGVSDGTGVTAGGGAPSAVDASTPTLDTSGTNTFADGTTPPSYSEPSTLDQIAGGAKNAGGSAMDWVTAHPAQAAMLGLSGVQALSAPKLPGAAKTALGASSQAVQQAQGILASGGTSSPQWQTTKAGIDSSIDEQLRNQTEALIQSAQNSGQGGKDSAVVQQRIGQLQQQANAARQQQYSQALSQIVSSAVSELSGGNATLGSIAQMQMSQDEQARAAASQTAELAMLLGSNKGG